VRRCGQHGCAGNVGGGRYGQLMIHVEVRGKVPGADGDGLPDVLVELEAGVTTVRELIRLAVGEQVRRLRGDAARCRRALDRQYLSEEDVREQARTGAIRLPTSPGRLDVAAEVAKAQRAFEREVFVVFAGGRQLRGLDEEVPLRIGQPIVFLRLTPLVGG
jgi:hypothetical protein